METLSSLASGSEIPNEVIIVDDGSKEMVSSHLNFSNYRFNLKVIRHSTRNGASAARNSGIRKAKCDLLLFIDDDIYPEYDMVHMHKFIHAQCPQKNYGVMGQILFDPYLPRTPLLHYLEMHGVFKDISNAPDRSRPKGLISAQFSLKRSFVEKKDLFDEKFPFNRNEDNEFGYRLCGQGWDLRHHIAARALHHNPIDLNTYFLNMRQSGFCHAYWSEKSPDDTDFCIRLGTSFKHKQQETELLQQIDNFVFNHSKNFFESDVNGCSEEELRFFFNWISHATTWIQSIGRVDAYIENIRAFPQIYDELEKAFNNKNTMHKIKYLRRAFEHNKKFFPLAILLANELERIKCYKEIIPLLEPFKHYLWSRLLLARTEQTVGNIKGAGMLYQSVYDAAQYGRQNDWILRRLASDGLIYLYSIGWIDEEWAERACAKLTDDDYVSNRKWCIALKLMLESRLLISKENYSQQYYEKIRNYNLKRPKYSGRIRKASKASI
jgi:glycosyltransferase involved in cell wall biosynthesis